MTMPRIDLHELSVRESERVEWKRDVASVDDVIKTAVAFANDFSNLGGGYIVCGAEESEGAGGFPKVEFVGLSSSRFKEIEGKVLSDCRNKVDPPIVPFVEVIPTPDPVKRVLVFLIPATEQAHSYRGSGKDVSTYYIRIGRETLEARNGLLRELLVRKKAQDPWDRRVNTNASLSDFDLLTFRDYLQNMGLWEPQKPLDQYLSPSESLSAFVPPLTVAQKLSHNLLPRNFALLMFCNEPTRFFPGSYCIFSLYPGIDRSESVSERIEITGTVVEQARRLINRLNAESFTTFDKTSTQPNLQRYPVLAFREAVVNALVHRDYELDQPVRVTVFLDRVEISSPGTLPRNINQEQFRKGQSNAFWRNQSLAYFFNKLQLAQAEGQGIPTILRTMREAGCPPPLFEVSGDQVTCVLPAHPRHRQLAHLRVIENKIILGKYDEAIDDLEILLKDDPYNFRSIEMFCEACKLSSQTQKVRSFFSQTDLDVSRINPTSLVIAAEVITLDNSDSARDLAKKLLEFAASGRVEESEVKRLALAVRKLGNDEQAIRLIDETLKRAPHLAHTSALFEIRAKAKMDLAKKCIDTARNPESSPRLKGRAWQQCREFLTDAEWDLQKALANGSDADREYIDRDIAFLNRLKQISRKPEKYRRRIENGRSV